MLGAPGVGKGTQASRLSAFYDIPKLSTGDMLRSAVSNGDKLSIEIKDILRQGLLVPDYIVEQIIEDKLCNDSNCKSGFILDGFPRTEHQAHFLEDVLKKLNTDHIFIINIKMVEKELIDRITKRVICSKCEYIFNNEMKSCPKCGSGEYYVREDDNEKIILNRLKIYDKVTYPIIKYYYNSGNLIEIDGNQSADDVFKEIIVAINNKIVV